MTKRSEQAERLLARVWRMIQGNQLTHYTDDVTQEHIWAGEKEKYEKDRKAFMDLYREILDFDPDEPEKG